MIIKPSKTPSAWNISTFLSENLVAKNPPRQNPKIAPKIGTISEKNPCKVWLVGFAFNFTMSPFLISIFFMDYFDRL